MEVDTTARIAASKAKIKANKKQEKEKDLKGKVTKGKGKDIVLNYSKFEGQGLNYKCKLFGYFEVPGPRGDKASVQAIQKLKLQAKQLKKGANEHKLKIIFNITLRGVRIINEKTQIIAYEHEIHKISFISHDPEDRHIFGYIYSPVRTSASDERKYLLFAIKAEKSADVITSQLYELFQVVYKLQENKKARGKEEATADQRQSGKVSQPLEPLQDKMLLEMSSKLGGEQQPSKEEHLYAKPSFAQSSASACEKPRYDIPRVNEKVEKKSEAQSPQFSSSSTRDPFYATSETENQIEADKETSSFSQVLNDNVFTSTSNEDSGFEADFDSATSSMSTEPKIDDPSHFYAEFPPSENGFTSPGTDIEITNQSGQAASSDQFQFDAFNSSIRFDISSEQKKDDISEKENNKSDVTVSDKVTEGEDSKANNIVSHDVQPKDIPSAGIDLSDPAGEKKITEDSNESDLTPVSKLGSDVKEIALSETENKSTASDSTNNFEVKFETKNEERLVVETSGKDVLSSFSNNSEAFSKQDPFSSCNTTEANSPTFGAFSDDDPFSPQGGANKEIMSDPFQENENMFSGGFTVTDENSEDFFENNEGEFSANFSSTDKLREGNFNDSDSVFNSKSSVKDTNTEGTLDESEQVNADFSSQVKQKTEVTPQNCEMSDDVFEAMFEAKIEGVENEPTEEENNMKDKDKVLPDPMDSRDESEERPEQVHEDKEKPGINLPQRPSQSDILKNDELTPENHEVILSESLENIENTIAGEVEACESSEREKAKDVNSYMSTGDDYVTLKTAAQTFPRPISPSEFSPPPLPPRPTVPFHIEPLASPEVPKKPPALPPRPSNQALNMETAMRRPPELPPRIDLEEKNSRVEPTITTSPLFQANFGSFDFNDVANNGDTTGQFHESATETSTDPFAGSDPFQTPVPGDPFASSPSFDRGYKQDGECFDPFSGDDPFAPRDPQASSDSPCLPPAQHLTFDDDKNDKNSDKFADFSGFSAAFTYES